MKLWFLTLLLLGVLLSAAWADQQQARRRRDVKSFQEADQADDEADDEEDEEEETDDDGEEEDEYSEEEVDVAKVEKEKKEDDRINPCMGKTCRRGEMCLVDKRHRARCVCIPKCREPESDEDARFQVCSRRNVTYPSECELDRDHCLCRRQQEGCSTPNTGKIRLDYYGPCQELTPCTEREFDLFPVRMRDWLYIIMKQMAQRAKIPLYMGMLEEAQKEANHSKAVIWKFCDLDVDPHDWFVTRRELLFTIQSLKALEHCLLPFLDHCDTDTDSRITLWEWGRCLGLDDDAIIDDCKSAADKGADQKNE